MADDLSPDRIRRRRILQAVGAGTLGALAIEGVTATPPDRYVVGTRSRSGTREARRRAEAVDRELDFGEIGEAVSGRFDDRARRALRRRADVRYVEPEGEMHATGHGDGLQTIPWGVDRVDADVAHHAGETGEGAHVAVLDTGIDPLHTDLAHAVGEGTAVVSCGERYGDGPSCGVDCASEWDDDDGHGTHAAGVVAAADDAEGVVGVAPDATLHAVKVLDCDGTGTNSGVAEGIVRAADAGWDVASMSLGGSRRASVITDACEYAADRGVLLVAAAGNAGPCSDCVGYPAAEPTVLAVGATDRDDALASFSATGPELELVAPGVDVYSTVPGGYAEMSGTSMACPHVAAAGGQLLASGFPAAESPADPDSPGGARQHLRWTAEDLGMADADQGHGLLDAERAVVDAHVLTIESPDDSYVRYQLEVDGTLQRSSAGGATLDDGDTVDGTVASGYVVGGRDSYTFSGEIVRFAADGDLDVTLDGERIDPAARVSEHTITVESADGSYLRYQLEGERDLRKSGALSSSLDDGDAVDGTVATGSVVGGRDSYTYTGGLERFAADGDAVVYLDGERIDPASHVSEHTLTIQSADGSFLRYQLAAEADLRKSRALSASIDDGDVIDDTVVSGYVVGGRDSYTFSGGIRRFAADGEAVVRMDGERIDPATRVAEHTITVESADGSYLRYQLEGDRDLRKSDALSSSLDDGDGVDGTVATGSVIGGRDSYVYAGDLVRYTDDGDGVIYLDGRRIDPATRVTEHTLTLASADRSRVDYEFSVERDLRKSRALSASLDDGDTAEATLATGYVVGGRDSYAYGGDVVEFDADGDLVGFLDGREVDPNAL